MKFAGTTAALLALVFLIPGKLFCSDMIERLDAKAFRVDSQRQIPTVVFNHPVSGEKIEKEFLIRDSTGFKRVKHLDKIKSGDLVTVDYREENGKNMAVYIDVVPVDRQVVSAGEVAGSLLKIKSKADR